LTDLKRAKIRNWHPMMRTIRYQTLTTILLASATCTGLRAGAVLEISRDTTLDPRKTYDAIVITASNVTLDGRGAWLLGPAARKIGAIPADFRGVAVSAKGASNVRLRNVNARGWETGLKVQNGAGWRIEQCNFSDNFHDPSFGWGENGRRGGIVLDLVERSTIVQCRANRVWDACVLVNSSDNIVEDNDFSHTSNTALKLWTSSRNRVRRNNLSYGLRKDPGEVHARDSTCVLMESGSNDNRLEGNNCTHGGDGIFIRVLNGWVSTGNVLEGNDCSYANNNGFEAWSPRNIYRHNKANYCSYGFWLGASDQTVLDGNEASHNGDPHGFHNSPHLPGAGHAGIVFMFGPSSHTICRNNTCVENNGAGIAVIGDMESKGRKWKAHHWIVERNRLEKNRWGLFLEQAEWLDLAANLISNNRDGDIKDNGGVTELTIHEEDPKTGAPPSAVLEAPAHAMVGCAIVFDASRSKLTNGQPAVFRWHLGDGHRAEGPRLEHVYKAPGFYRVGLTVTSGPFSDLVWRDLYVVEPLDELGTEGADAAAKWSFIDPRSRVAFTADRHTKIAGESAVYAFVNPYGGERVSLRFPAATDLKLPLENKSKLVFWIRSINENIPAWQNANPVLTLYESPTRFVRLEPRQDLLSSPPYNEAREGWTYITVPLEGDELWKREGSAIAVVNYLTVGFDSWGSPPLRIWLDGLAIK
jgi:parallel beta-helix repeat protein